MLEWTIVLAEVELEHPSLLPGYIHLVESALGLVKNITHVNGVLGPVLHRHRLHGPGINSPQIIDLTPLGALPLLFD